MFVISSRFVPHTPFQSSKMFVRKAGAYLCSNRLTRMAYLSEAPLYRRLVLALKHQTMLKMLSRDKQSIFLRVFVNYRLKKVYNIRSLGSYNHGQSNSPFLTCCMPSSLPNFPSVYCRASQNGCSTIYLHRMSMIQVLNVSMLSLMTVLKPQTSNLNSLSSRQIEQYGGLWRAGQNIDFLIMINTLV